MNFQAVSVGQKLASDKADRDATRPTATSCAANPGATWTPRHPTVLAYGLEKTDLALASMIQALKNQGLYQSTLFIVTAKTAKSPIDPRKTNKPGHFADLLAALPDAAGNPAALGLRPPSLLIGSLRIHHGRRRRAHLAAGPSGRRKR